MAVALARIAGAALDRESEYDAEVDAHFERRRHELNDWLNVALKQGLAALADDD